MTLITYELKDHRSDKTNDIGLIFVHGSAGCAQVWKNQLKNLPAKLIAVNLPGHDGSKGPETPTIKTYVEALDDLIQNLKLNKVILVGHSMGGAVVMSYYLKYPGKINGLVLIGTGARLRVVPMILDLAQNNYPQLVKMIGEVAFHKETSKEVVEELGRYMAQNTAHIAFYDFSICNQFDVMERLGEIKVPTLIICGDDDKLTPVKYSSYLHEHIANSHFHVIAKAGHMVMLEKGEAINKLIDEFYKSI